MRLEPICELDAAYRDSSFGEKFVLVRPYGNEGGAGYGELDGTVTGDKLRGSLRLTNHPRRRSDGAMLPDAHGLIKTHDDALVLVSLQGRTVFTEAGGRQLLSVLFETEDERYKWLNNSVCILEGTFDPQTMRMRAKVYACVSETS
ncbi:MAG: DUF3237 domain-containing protein [Thermoplasmata archaeon]|nr:DUF3237 domain-containing protein [Thermoplasmata archaeon]